MDSFRKSGCQDAALDDAARHLVAMDEARKGRFGEAICEQVTRASGVTYIPLCKIAGVGAPASVSTNDKITLPDFDIAGDGIQAYLDAKCKTRSARYHNRGQVRHGIDGSKHEAYERAGLLRNKQCGLFIVELLDDVGNWSGTLLVGSFLGLGKPIPGFSNQKHMVYWPRRNFNNLGAYSPDSLIEIATGKLNVDMSATLKTEFSAPPPRCPDCEHIYDAGNWINEPHPGRPGWIRTTCKKCGVFIGNKPA